jgi:hypothetical protein
LLKLAELPINRSCLEQKAEAARFTLSHAYMIACGRRGRSLYTHVPINGVLGSSSFRK